MVYPASSKEAASAVFNGGAAANFAGGSVTVSCGFMSEAFDYYFNFACDRSQMILTNFTNTRALGVYDGYGGALLIYMGCQVYINSCLFEGNIAAVSAITHVRAHHVFAD